MHKNIKGKKCKKLKNL